MRSFLGKRRGAFLLCALLALATAGCGDGSGEAGGGGDTQPVSKATPSQARLLIETYCKGGASEAKGANCTRSVKLADICPQDTEAKQQALTAYIKKTGDYGICD